MCLSTCPSAGPFFPTQETSAQYWPLKDTEPATYDSFLIRLGEEMDLYDNKLRVRELLLTHTEVRWPANDNGVNLKYRLLAFS